MPHGPRNPTAVQREVGVSAGQGQCTKVSRTDRDVVPDGCGHGDGIGGGAETTCADSLSSRRVQKVEFERLVGEEVDPRNIGWGIQETLDKV